MVEISNALFRHSCFRHAPLGSPLLVAVALLCGMAWGTLRAVSGSLVPGLLAHLVWDISVFLWLPLDSSLIP